MNPETGSEKLATIIEETSFNWRIASKLANIALAYFAANKIALLVPDAEKVLTAVWPAAGIGMAALLLNPRRLWPVILTSIFLAGNAANLISGRPLLNSLGFMTANVFESVSCAWLLTSLCGNSIRFTRVKEVGALIVAAIFMNACSALLGAMTASLAAISPFWDFWQTWLVADGLGILLITPLIVSWADVKTYMFSWRNHFLLESTVFLTFWCAVSWYSFQPHQVHAVFTPQPYMLVALLCWPALRLGWRTLTISLALLSIIAVTSHYPEELEPLLRGGNDMVTSLLIVQVFIGLTAITAFLLVSTMIERKQVQETLQLSQQRYSLLVDNSMDAIFLADMSGRFIDVNREAERQTGYSRNELLRLGILDVDAQQTPETMERFMPGLLRQGWAAFETLHRHKSGGLIPIDLRVTVVQEEGRTLVLGFARDITERNSLESQLKESEEKFRTVADFTHDWEYWLGVDGRLVWVSPSCEVVTGYTSEDYLSDPDLLRRVVHKSDGALFDDHLQDVMAGVTAPCDMDFRIVHKAGQTVWLNHKCVSISRTDGTSLGRRTSNRDITDRKKMEMALEDTNRKLETLSATDGLTGIANRRRFDEVLAQEHARHARSEADLSLILLDIDHFKAFNDIYGHVPGDECLRQVARTTAGCVTRPADLVARYGGEEFVCILPETDHLGVLVLAEEIRRSILGLAIPHKGSDVAEFITASLGVVTVKCTVGGAVEDIIAQADDLLYQAKASGRNQIKFA